MPDPHPHPPVAARERVRHARIPSPEERAAQLLAMEREVTREERRDVARTLVACALYCLSGVALMSWAVHTTDLRYAGIAFWGGLAFGNAGILLTLAGAYRRSLER